MPTCPGAEAWRQLKGDLNLTDKQLRALRITVQHAFADVEAYEAARADAPDRAAYAKAIARLEKTLLGVREALADSADLHDHLPGEFLAAIGEKLSYSSVSTGAVTALRPRFRRRYSRRARSEPIKVGDVEGLTIEQRRALGVRHGAAALEYAMVDLAAPLSTWLSKNRENPGGAPADYVRRHFIDLLAEGAVEIIGKPASASKTGPFVRLCAAVLGACGLSQRGVEDAVERALAGRETPRER
jgi:hypothetical protein